ncbi:MAG: DNA-processing protein DprA [Planctomycetota bacterium]
MTFETQNHARAETIQAVMSICLANTLNESQIRRLLEHEDAPEAIIGSSTKQLAQAVMIDLKTAERLLQRIEEDDVRLGVFREMEQLQRNEIRMYTLKDEGYPIHLRSSYEAPPYVYIWGCYSPQFLDAVSILGSSDCSRYGSQQALRVAKACAEAGWSVVTGGEVGVDRLALEAGLEAGGRVIAALGAGIFGHGRQHHDLYERIVSSGQGCVISSVPTQTPPLSSNQVTGDLLTTGLSKALCVIEASEKSGSLIAVRAMENIWRRPVFALPGPIDSLRSIGTNQLIYRGRAKPVISTDRFIADMSEYRMPIQPH